MSQTIALGMKNYRGRSQWIASEDQLVDHDHILLIALSRCGGLATPATGAWDTGSLRR